MLAIKTALLTIVLGIFSVLLAGETIIGKERVVLKEHKSFQDGKFLKVIATFENEDDDEVEGMVYQIEWLDSKGIVVDTTSWKPFTIIGKQKINVVDMAHRQDVTNYHINISTPNK